MNHKKIVDQYFTIVFFIIPATWAGSFIAGKYVLADLDPIPGVFLRFLLSALVMFPFLIVFHRKAHPSFRDRNFIYHLFSVVMTGGVIYHLFFFWALSYTSPTNTALIIALNPFFTAFAEIILFKKLRSLLFYTGFLLSFGGAIWVIISRGNGLTWPGFGELLCLIASVSWSVYTITAKLTKRAAWDSLWIGAYNYVFTALLLLPFILPSLMSYNTISISKEGWLSLWYMAVFPTAIGYTLFYIGVQRKGPAWAATFIYLVPSITANLDHFFFGARFTVPMVVGITLVVIGLLIGNLTRDQLNWVIERLKSMKATNSPT
jgi:drug/metabolite transporter (DMT)-like permease